MGGGTPSLPSKRPGLWWGVEMRADASHDRREVVSSRDRLDEESARVGFGAGPGRCQLGRGRHAFGRRTQRGAMAA